MVASGFMTLGSEAFHLSSSGAIDLGSIWVKISRPLEKWRAIIPTFFAPQTSLLKLSPMWIISAVSESSPRRARDADPVAGCVSGRGLYFGGDRPLDFARPVCTAKQEVEAGSPQRIQGEYRDKPRESDTRPESPADRSPRGARALLGADDREMARGRPPRSGRALRRAFRPGHVSDRVSGHKGGWVVRKGHAHRKSSRTGGAGLLRVCGCSS